MRLFGQVDGAITNADRAMYLSMPFDRNWLSRIVGPMSRAAETSYTAGSIAEASYHAGSIAEASFTAGSVAETSWSES